MRILVPNLGSTSLKYQLFEMDGERVIARGRIEAIGSGQSRLSFRAGDGETVTGVAAVPDHRAAVDTLLEQLGGLEEDRIDAVGLKTVHGGPRYAGSFAITDDVLEAMQEFSAVAPVHNPIYVQAIEILRAALPGVPMVGVFEPGFHATIPERAYLYGVPNEWAQDFGVRRYGFHGSSHRYVAQRVPELLGRPADGLRLVSCHLGGSSSICAVLDGASVDCSFGFSPQSGLEQGTRCGDLDPFAVLYVMERAGLSTADMAAALCKRSGLLALSGVSGELREIEEAADGGDTRAALALEVFVHGVKKQIGASAAVLGGLDALAFAGGIGENAWRIRRKICAGLEFLGVELDLERNREPDEGGVISTDGSPVFVVVVRTDEELVVARETLRVLRGS